MRYAILATLVLSAVAVGQSKPPASLAANKSAIAISELSCKTTVDTLTTLANWKNEPGHVFPTLPMMTLGETLSALTQCLGKFEWSNDDTARILALNILVLTDQASRSAHFIGQQGLWQRFVEEDESAANLAGGMSSRTE